MSQNPSGAPNREPPVAAARPAVSRPRVRLIAAVASNGVIGANGALPWRLPEDLRRFKALTLGHPVLMGRRTWESLGRPLPGRDNVVVSRRADFVAPGARTAATFEQALELCAGAECVSVIGGGALYAAALPVADALLLTELADAYEGDAHFPPFDRGTWRETAREPHAAADGLRYDFVRYERAAAAAD